MSPTTLQTCLQGPLSARRVDALAAQLALTLRDPMYCSPTRLLCPWDSPGKTTGVRCRALLQGIFPTQGLSPGLLCRRQTPTVCQETTRPSTPSSSLHAEGPGAGEPQSRPFPQGLPSLLNPCWGLGSATITHPSLKYQGCRGEGDGEGGGEDAENFPCVAEYRLHGAWAGGDSTLSVLQKLSLKAADGPCGGPTRSSQAVSPSSPLTAQTARSANLPEQKHPLAGPPCSRPAPEDSPPARARVYLGRCWAAAQATQWCWGPPGRTRASVQTPRQPPAWGGRHLSRAGQKNEGVSCL